MNRQSMQLSLRSYGARTVTHAHDFHQIVFPVVGALKQPIGTSALSVSPDQFATVGRGVRHSFSATGANRFVVLETNLPVVGPGVVVGALNGSLAELVRYAASELNAEELPVKLEFHLAALLTEKIAQASVHLGRNKGLIQQAISIITRRYAEGLTAAVLAREVGLGVSQLHAQFRRATGKGPAEALADRRLDVASMMLRETALPIAEIALAVGFSDQSALTRCLSKRRGITPAAMRRSRPRD